MEGPPGISAERARLLLRGGDGAAMWGRRVGERGKMLRERPRDRAEELTSGPGRSGTERAGEARAGLWAAALTRRGSGVRGRPGEWHCWAERGVREGGRSWARRGRSWAARAGRAGLGRSWGCARAGLGKNVWASFGFPFLWFSFPFFFKHTQTNLNSNKF